MVDGIIATNVSASADSIAKRTTLEIIFANMELLRPIFLLTQGRMGCVSLQVNVKMHNDAEAMRRDVLALYEELTTKLHGVVPNVVFKLPATKAGLEACQSLTKLGRGVNITASFGLFQQLAFARAIDKGMPFSRR